MFSKSSFKKNLLVFSLFFIGCLLYIQCLDYSFVWDDHFLIRENSQMNNISSIKEFFTQDLWENSTHNYKSGFYRPVTLTAFLLNYQIWQGSPAGFHFLNIFLHSINGVLLFLIFFKLTKNNFISFLAGLLFLVHPLQTETVAFIADLGDILVVLFILLSLSGYINFVLNGRKKKYYGWSLVFLLFALLSKENAMAGFLLIILVDFCFFSNMSVKQIAKKARDFIPYVLLTLAYIGWRVIILGKLNAVTTLENVRYVSILPAFDFGSHLMTTARILTMYLTMFFYPVEQSITYIVLPVTQLLTYEAFGEVLLIISLLGLTATALIIKRHWLFFALFWFWATLLPLSNLIPISNTIAERFMYLPNIGLCFLLAYILNYIKERKLVKHYQKILFVTAVSFFVLALSVKTFERSMVWENDYFLFSSDLDAKPCSPIAHANLNVYYNLTHQPQKSLLEYAQYQSCQKFIQQQYRRLKKSSL